MELLPNKPIHDSSLVYDNIFNFQGCVLKFSNNCKISKVSVEAEIMTEQLYCRIAEQRNLWWLPWYREFRPRKVGYSVRTVVSMSSVGLVSFWVSLAIKQTEMQLKDIHSNTFDFGGPDSDQQNKLPTGVMYLTIFTSSHRDSTRAAICSALDLYGLIHRHPSNLYFPSKVGDGIT